MKNMMAKNMTNGGMGAISADIAENFAKAMANIGMETKLFEAGKVPFEELPEAVKAEVLDTLKAYDRVTVTYANGKFNVSTAVFISASYAFDDCTCGTYYAKDLYTKEECRANFIEVFGYEPYRA